MSYYYPLNLRSFALTGGWKPPPNQVFSAALGLAITAWIAIRFTLEVPRTGDFLGAFGAFRHALLSANHLIMSVRH